MRRNLEDRVRTIAGIAGLLALLAALAVLLGWELDIGWLKSAGAGPADMKPLTATCLACFGAALVFTDGLPRFPAGNRVGLGFAVVGTTIAVATLIEYGSGVELGFDRALFAEAVARSGLPYPGRMAPMSAVALTLLGSAILLRDRRSSTADTAGSLCLVIAGMICLLGLLGYLYGASSLYQVPAYSSMARHTALLVIVLVIATALSRPRRSLVEPFLAPGSGGVMARYVLPPSVALLIGLGWLRLFGESIGMYDTAFGLAVLVGAFVLIFGTLLWFVARSLNRQDDRTRAAEDLRMRLLESLDQASEAVIVLDAEGRINTWNAGASRLYGYTAAEAIGRYNIDLLTTPDMVDERNDIRQRMERQTGYAYESRRVTRAGDVIDVEISFVPMRDHDGHITGQLALTHDISARKQLVQALRREEARWRLIVESAPHGVIIVDHNGRITLVNRQAELSFGYTRDEMVGSPIEMLLPMAIRDDHVTVRTAYLRHPEARKMGVGRELFGRRKDGSDMSVEVGLSPLESGSEVFIVATVVDITERREAEQRLASERSLLRTLIDALPDLVFTKDLEGRYVLCNAATLQHVGARTPEDVIGQRIFDVYERDLARQYHDDDEQVLRGATVLNREERGVTADGREVWFLTTKVPIRAADGTVTGLVGVSRDITTRRAMADALSLSETRFRHLVESLPQLIWTCSPDGLCDFLSPQWVAYTGVPAENHLGLGWIDQVHPEDREATITAWLAAVTGDRDLRLEFRLKRHDGVYRWFDMRAVRQRDAAGRIVKWFGSNTDIQERRHGDELLRRAQKMEALGTLAGGIAHDFNNILLAITGNAKLAVEDTAPDHPARESLLEIEAAANRAGELVARILSFSRQQDGRLQSIRLQPVIEEVLRLLRATLPATIEIRPRFAPDAGFVSADSTQIHQVLMNLATNAAHAIDNRPGAIEILLDSVDVDADFVESVPGLAPGPHVRLSVIDNGCGMTSDIVERVFDPFFTTKPPGQGTGLGLSVVHGIVRQHHGAITVYSEPRRGTTFRLYFPVVAGDGSLQPEATRPSEARTRSERLLYVDDERALLQVVSRTLSRLGYQVTASSNPVEALQIFSDDPDRFDAVVMDLSMPGMSGFDLARAILSRRDDIPTVLTSGFLQPEDHLTASAIGIRAVLQKPDAIRELVYVLDDIFA